MDSLFDQLNDKSFGGDNQRENGFESPDRVFHLVEPDRAVEGASSFSDPKLMATLHRLALRYLPGNRNWHNREDLVQSALQYLLKLSAKHKGKAPLSDFRPNDHAWHAIQRVLRKLRSKKDSFSSRMPALSSLPEGKVVMPKSRPSNHEFQARLAIETAMAKLDQRPREIVLTQQSPDPDMTLERIAGYSRCSKATVSNVIKKFRQLLQKTIDDQHLN